MDELMNRLRTLAEAVMIMVCPVLLAIALNKVDLKSEEHGRAIPILMLVAATVSLTSGALPFLICCVSKLGLFPIPAINGAGGRSIALVVINLLTPLSCACVIAIACWIIRLIMSDNWTYPAVGAVFVLCILIRTVSYCCAQNAQPPPAAAQCKLESSLEFLSGVTALLFLGLEGLALEGQSQIRSDHGIQQHHLAAQLGSSFVACVLGVSFMLVETIPPLTPSGDDDDGWYRRFVSDLTEIFDAAMAIAVGVVMLSIMYSLVKIQALLLLAPPFLILVVRAFEIAVGGEGGEDLKPASLELTKVTFTGFLAVSVPAISSGSLNTCTEWFLLLAAAAVASGIVERLLTHYRSAASANVASFCAHLCVAIATMPFTVMAGKAI